MTTKQLSQLKQIRLMLAELHQNWAEKGGGHHKSQEGYIGLELRYPNWFEADTYVDDAPEVEVEIYSYLFGSGRLHHYQDLDDALKDVTQWHKDPDNWRGEL